MGFAVGALTAAAALARMQGSGRPRERERVLERLPQCTVSLVLVGVDPSSPISTGIDAKTGRAGFSHVYLDACRVDELGRRVVIDYTAARGVHWSDASGYAARAKATIELGGELGAEVFGCVASKLGAPFRIAPLIAMVENDTTCTGLIVHCMPPALRRELRDRTGDRCVSPNDLARFFGVAPGDRITADAVPKKRGPWASSY